MDTGCLNLSFFFVGHVCCALSPASSREMFCNLVSITRIPALMAYLISLHYATQAVVFVCLLWCPNNLNQYTLMISSLYFRIAMDCHCYFEGNVFQLRVQMICLCFCVTIL
jgi:hypothetical protein